MGAPRQLIERRHPACWMGANLPISPELGAAVREQLDAAAGGMLEGAEMQAVAPILEMQARLSAIPARASC